MAPKHERASTAGLNRQVALLTGELAELKEQQAATADVLKVISRSTFDLQVVLDTLVEAAARLCGADMAAIARQTGTAFHYAATYGFPPELDEYLSSVPHERGRGSAIGRALLAGETVQIPDVLADPDYEMLETQRRAGFRTVLGVPLLRDGRPIGVIALTHVAVRPFTDKQVELVKTFADQAVIAIENARLFEEVQSRNREVTQTLEQQTATSEILRVISTSPTDVQPVFETIVRNAVTLCGSLFANVFRFDGELLHFAASHNVGPDYVGLLKTKYPMRPDASQVSGRVILGRSVVRVENALLDPNYDQRFPSAMGWRRMLGVPMLRDGDPLGVIIVGWAEPGPILKTQEELLKTFADQAVIAIENVRLFEEVQARTAELSESLEQQTATREILSVVASSPTDIRPVLTAIVESAARLCEAFDSVLLLRDGDDLAFAAHHGPIPVDFDRWPVSRKWAAGRAAVDRQAVHVYDLQNEADEFSEGRAMALQMGHRTTLSVPLMREGEAIGALTVRRTEVRPFSGKQVSLLTTFADQAVIAIDNARLFEEAQTRNRELAEALEQQVATSGILRAIAASPTNIEPVLRTVAESAAQLCDAYDATLLLKRGDALAVVAHHGPIPIDFKELPIHRGMVTSRAFIDRVPVHVPDLRAAEDEFPEARAYAERLGFRTILGTPLLREDEAVGALMIRRDEVRPFTDKQIELLTTFADQAVIAIENVRLFEEVQARTADLTEALQQQTATADVLKVISRSAFDLQTVLDTLVESAVRLCRADKGTLERLIDGAFRYDATYGFTASDQAYLIANPTEAGRGSAVGRAMEQRRIVQIEDVLEDTEYTIGAVARMSGFRTVLAVPLLREEELIGVFSMVRDEVRPFSLKEIELVQTFADQAVIAIENVRLFEEVQARTAELTEALQQQTATADVLKVISRSTFDLETVLQTLVESATRLGDADNGTITRSIDGVFYRTEAYGFSPEFVEYVRQVPVVPERGSVTGRALLEKSIVHVPDVEMDPDYTFAEAQKLGGFRTILGVPMMREGVALGVLALTRSEVRPFTEKQIELVSTFADQAAIAIENVRLFEEVKARTQELSRSLEDLRAAQDRLIQTEKLASLGQLTAGIAHEIKNPLNFVNNFSALSSELIAELRELLQRASLGEKPRAEVAELTDMLQGNLEKVVQHGKRADSIVKNMLLHSRAGSGEHRLTDINAIVEESLNLAYHGARAERPGFNITLEKNLDPQAGAIDLFPQEITRVLLNLISNGFYATAKRGREADGMPYEPRLLASTRDLGDRVEIRIRDNGTGIPPEVKEKMFVPFFTTKPAGEGTGLGLSLSHDIIVKQHAGSIEVDTAPGEFTEFRIVLPRAAASLGQSGGPA
jgi:GAF domain-containing protein